MCFCKYNITNGVYNLNYQINTNSLTYKVTR